MSQIDKEIAEYKKEVDIKTAQYFEDNPNIEAVNRGIAKLKEVEQQQTNAMVKMMLAYAYTQLEQKMEKYKTERTLIVCENIETNIMEMPKVDISYEMQKKDEEIIRLKAKLYDFMTANK